MRLVFKWYSRTMDCLFFVIKVLLAIFLAIMVCVTMLEVVRRYVMGQSFPWSEELVRFLLVIVTFLGGAAAYRAGGMVNLDLLTNHFPPRLRAAVEILINTLVIIFCVYLSVNGFAYSFSRAIMRQTSTGLDLPMIYVYAIIPVSFVFLVLFAVEKYPSLFSKMMQSPAAETSGECSREGR